MSNVNIKRAVENIRSGTTAYTPLVEIIVNAIQAIEEAKPEAGKIEIIVERSKQEELERGLPHVEGFTIKDNGIGFTKANRDSFDTLYSDYKIAQGGKGFGRFTCLKYFNDLRVESIFLDGDSFKKRSFSMGKRTDIIVNEKIADVDASYTGSQISLSRIKDKKFPEKQLTTISRSLVERLLPYFIDKEYTCPQVDLVEADGTNTITLNNFIRNQISLSIEEMPLKKNTFTLGGVANERTFEVRIFKIYSPKNQKSKISLVADRREVTETPIHNYVPEFINEFYDDVGNESDGRDRNYIIKAYVFSPYLDSNVSLERGGFEFQKDNDLLLGISQSDIESAAAEIARHALGSTISARQEKKKKHVLEYIESSAPWHKTIAEDIDLSSMPYNPTPEQIETTFQKEKFNQEVAIRRDVVAILTGNNTSNIAAGVSGILSRISKTSQNDLIHYIALRKSVLDIFSRSLEFDDEGKYSSEGTVHDIIFPRKGDCVRTSFGNHNLWIVDERLNFTNFVSSDTPLDGHNSDRPDLLAYNTSVLFRGDNEPSNPLTIFEFKKPQRDDFANPSSKDDPVQQIVRYVNQIREGKYKTPKGRDILVAQNTPVYGYVICDINQKVDKWLHQEKDFSPMPDRRGWFKWFGNNNLYMEVLSWDKVLKDATMRNKVFFHTLGIE